jgi:hypothetical protein
MEIDYDRLFCFVDDFVKDLKNGIKKALISSGANIIAFHQSGMSCFKYFYLDLVRNYRNLFKSLLHYDRFVALIKAAFPAVICLFKTLEGTITEYIYRFNSNGGMS